MALPRFPLFAKKLASQYERYRVASFMHRHFVPQVFSAAIDDLAEHFGDRVRVREIGLSFEQRPIRLYSAGHGATQVLLWSQMHGDESTATMAIADILHYLAATHADAATQKLMSALTIHFLPMLNPDGAELCQRRTVQGIDMNRDAIALVTPEARLLRRLQKDLRPQFGYNLHDQELSTVGASPTLTAIGLLAPALNEGRTDDAVRTRAKRLASVFARSILPLVKGKVAKYDDTFEPRAFGDNMQKWGTSTLLVESGHAVNDPQKDLIRKLNFVGILTSLYSIATREYAGAATGPYERLPFNGKKAYETIIRNVTVEEENGTKVKVDLGLSSQVDTHSEPPSKLVDIGDLTTFTALKEIEARGKSIPRSQLKIGRVFEWN